MSTTWTWSQKRQAYIILFFSGVVFFVVMAFLTFDFFTKSEDVYEDSNSYPLVMWSNVFPVRGDHYGFIAFFHNTESNFKSLVADYQLVFFDENGESFAKHKGETFFGPGESFFIFEREIIFEDKKPAWTTVYWENIEWQEVGEDYNNRNEDIVLSGDVSVKSDLDSSYLQTAIKNIGDSDVSKVEVLATVLDEYENVLLASRSTVGPVFFDEEKKITLSWPSTFDISEGVSCDDPLQFKVNILEGSGENERYVESVLSDLDKNIKSEFSWSVDSIDLENRDIALVENQINSEINIFNSYENPLFVIIYPDDGKVDLSFLDDIRKNSFVRMISMSYKEEEGINIDKEAIKGIVKRNCIQKPRDVEVYTRVKN